MPVHIDPGQGGEDMPAPGFRVKETIAAVAIVLLGLGAIPGRAASPVSLTFGPHGTFFSAETHQPAGIDPQVFVKIPGMAGVGPQRIAHVMGVMPAHLADPASAPLYTARGKPLRITLGRWLGAHGMATIETMGSHGERVTASFTGLIPRGSYSLFLVDFQPGGTALAPLDGMGKSNNFVASVAGTGSITVTTPTMLPHNNAVLLVYHSDGRAHGVSRGVPGVTAHDQLIARVP
jgi:hypothetical protein